MNVDDIVRIRIEEAARKVEAARRKRQERQRARTYGLAQRHAAKLRYLSQKQQQNDQPPDAA